MVCGCAVRLSLGVRQKQQPAMAVAQVELRTAVRRAEAKALLLFARVISPPNQQREEYEQHAACSHAACDGHQKASRAAMVIVGPVASAALRGVH